MVSTFAIRKAAEEPWELAGVSGELPAAFMQALRMEDTVLTPKALHERNSAAAKHSLNGLKWGEEIVRHASGNGG